MKEIDKVFFYVFRNRVLRDVLWREVSAVHRRLGVRPRKLYMMTGETSSPEFVEARLRCDRDYGMPFGAIKRFLTLNSDFDRFIYVYGRCEVQFRIMDQWEATSGRLTESFVVNYIDRICQDGTLEVSRDKCYQHIELLSKMTVGPLLLGIHDAMSLGAKYNDIGLFKYLYEHNIGHCQSFAKTIVYACNIGNLFQFHETHPEPDSNINTKDYYKYINTAADFGHVELIRYLLETSPERTWDGMALVNAARGGHIEAIKMLHNLDGPHMWSTDGSKALEWAAELGHADVVEFLVNNRTEGNINNALKVATRYPNIVRFLVAKGAAVSQAVRNSAASLGDLETLMMWPHVKIPGSVIGEMYCRDNVVEADYLIQEYGTDKIEHHELFMRMAGRRSRSFTYLACSIVVRGSNGPVIIYTREQGMVCLMEQMLAAGHLDLFKWTLANMSSIINIPALSLAIFKQFKGILPLSISQPIIDKLTVCEINDQYETLIFKQSAKHGFHQLFSVMCARGFKPNAQAIRAAVVSDRLEVVKILLAINVSIHKSNIFDATIAGCKSVVIHLYPLQSQSTRRTIESLAKTNKHVDLLELFKQSSLDIIGQ
eukprot:gene17017-20262_t